MCAWIESYDFQVTTTYDGPSPATWSVHCFQNFKTKMGTVIAWKTRPTLTKLEFATAISSDDVWEQSFTKTSIVNGFTE